MKKTLYIFISVVIALGFEISSLKKLKLRNFLILITYCSNFKLENNIFIH